MLRAKRQGLAKRSLIPALVLSCLGVLSLQPAAYAEPKTTIQKIEIHRLSKEYRKGYAFEQKENFELARKVYELGAEKGDPMCMYRLGVFNVEGLGGLPKDNSRGLKLIKRAARSGEQDAYYWLGQAYLEGLHGVRKNSEKGVKLINRAARMGSPEAISALEHIRRNDNRNENLPRN